MNNFTKDNSGKLTLDVHQTFCNLFYNYIGHEYTFIESFNEFDKILWEEWKCLKNKDEIHVDEKSFDGTLKRAHGEWYELLVALFTWNYSCNNQTYRLIKIPNKNSLSIHELYKKDIFEVMERKMEEIHEAGASFNVTNPDFIIVDLGEIEELPQEYYAPIVEVTTKNLKFLDTAYKRLKRKCTFSSIKGYLGLKVSVRSDRVNLFTDEASNLKSFMKGYCSKSQYNYQELDIKYYAGIAAYNNANEKSLKRIGTNSLLDWDNPIEILVNNVFQINNYTQLEEISQFIQNEKAA